MVTLGWMILEHCGDSVPRKMASQDKMQYVPLSSSPLHLDEGYCTFRTRIHNTLVTIHTISHVKHDDMGSNFRHVLIRGSEETKDVDIRIIDLDHWMPPITNARKR